MEKSKQLLDHIYNGLMSLHSSRTGMEIHATNLIDFCPRAFLLCQREGLLYNDEEKVPGRRIITFEVGKAVEGVILRALQASGVLRPLTELYINVTPEIKVLGTPDGACILTIEDEVYIIELKTTGKDEIETMIEPYINHVCQLSLYLWMAEIRKAPYVYTDGFVVYVSKLEKKEGIKVYHVQRNEAFIGRVREQLQVLKTFSESGGLPPRICNSPTALMAKNHCGIPKICFKEG